MGGWGGGAQQQSKYIVFCIVRSCAAPFRTTRLRHLRFLNRYRLVWLPSNDGWTQMTNKCTPLWLMWRRFNHRGSGAGRYYGKKKACKMWFWYRFQPGLEQYKWGQRKGEQTQRHKDKKRNIIYTFNECACPKASVFNHLFVWHNLLQDCICLRDFQFLSTQEHLNQSIPVYPVAHS